MTAIYRANAFLKKNDSDLLIQMASKWFLPWKIVHFDEKLDSSGCFYEIEGYHLRKHSLLNNAYLIMKTEIRKTSLASIELKSDEQRTCVIVSPDVVYTIQIDFSPVISLDVKLNTNASSLSEFFYKDQKRIEEYLQLQSVDAFDLMHTKNFGLPPIVFMTWLGMISLHL